MSNFINSSALTKLLANVFVFLVLVMALGIAGFDALTGQAINPYVSGLIFSGLGYAGTILGFHVGGAQALQAQSQLQGTPPTATVPVAVQVQQAAPVAPAPIPVDMQATAQRPAVLVPGSSQTRSSSAISG
jgi:hypothetical protein